MDMKVKRDFVLEVSLTGEPSPQTILEAIATLRDEALKEFGEGYQERTHVIGPPAFGMPPDIAAKQPSIIFRAFPPKDAYTDA